MHAQNSSTTCMLLTEKGWSIIRVMLVVNRGLIYLSLEYVTIGNHFMAHRLAVKPDLILTRVCVD